MRARNPKSRLIYVLTSALASVTLNSASAHAWDWTRWSHHPTPSPTPSAGEIQQTVYGPATFFADVTCRTVYVGFGREQKSELVCTDESKTEEKSFAILNTTTPFTLNLQNNGLLGAWIELDHREIWRADQFSSATELLSVPVHLRMEDQLSVHVRSLKPGSSLTLWITAAVGELPPSPASAAPPLNPSEPMTFAGSTSFLYTGSNPIQTGVASGTIQARQSSVIRGKTLATDGSAVSGVQITVLGHPELGTTYTRSADGGEFDLAVNGGQPLTVVYTKTGYFTAQRTIQVPWQSYVVVDTVVLTAADSAVSEITLGVNSPVQIHQANIVSDPSGSRQSTVIFPPGTTASLLMPNGTTSSLGSISVRATEITVGPNGPKAMPAPLPGTSIYTYAAELSADEAISAGAVSVEFNHPVYEYVDNFLSFPVGTRVPVGFYDFQSSGWVPGSNGRVLKILSLGGGLASLDVDGNGQPATAAELTALGFTSAERQTLASTYAVGKTLWRMPIPHFSLVDGNLGGQSGGTNGNGNTDPTTTDPVNPTAPTCTTCPCPGASDVSSGSTITGLTQVVRESFPVVGTPYTLNYSSDRNPARTSAKTLQIPITSSQVSSDVQEIDLEISVAGEQFAYAFPPVPNQTFTFTWDGLDAYGRAVTSTQFASVLIAYQNQAYYTEPAGDPAFGNPSQTPLATQIPTRFPVASHVIYFVPVGTLDARGAGLGGMDLSVHHAYDTTASVLYLGNGTKRGFSISDARNVALFAGNGGMVDSGDGGPATQASLNIVRGLAALSDGSILIADTSEVRKVAPNGTISRVSITTPAGAQLNFSSIAALALVSDSTGYILDGQGAAEQTLYFVSQGVAMPVQTLTGATQLAVQSDGTVYILEANNIVLRQAPGSSTLSSYSLSSLVGSDTASAIAVSTDGGDLYLGTQAGRLWDISNASAVLDLDPSGVLPVGHIALGSNGRIFFSTPPGSGLLFQVSSGRAMRIPLLTPLVGLSSILIGPVGEIYAGMGALRQVNLVNTTYPGAPAGSLSIASSDATEIYDFDSNGRHLDTRDAFTNAVKVSFNYAATGGLQSIVDTFGNTTTVLRDTSGNPTALVSPDGLTTQLQVNSDLYLTSFKNPNGETFAMNYASGTGLLTDLGYPNPGEVAHHTYDSLGRLASDEDAAGDTTALTPAIADGEAGIATNASVRSPAGINTEFNQNLNLGTATQTTVLPDGTSTTNQSTGATNSVTGADGSQTLSTLAQDPRFGTQALFPGLLQTVMPSGYTQTFQVQKQVTYNPVSPPAAPTFLLQQLTNKQIGSGPVFSASQQFDSSTLTWSSSSFAGIESTRVLTPSGQISQLSLPSVASVNYGYDARGRLTSTSQSNRTTQYTYNAQGFLSSAQPPLIGPTVYTYDGAGRVISTLYSDGVRESFTTYDADGNVTSITPPGRPAWLFSYDAVGDSTSTTPPAVPGAGGATLYHYNADRKLSLIQLPDGSQVQLNYDPVSGNLVSRVAPEGTTTYGYTPGFPYLTSVTNPSSPGATETVQLGYDGSTFTTSQWSGEVSGLVSEIWSPNSEQLTRTTSVGGSSVTNTNYFDADGNSIGSDYLTIERQPNSILISSETTINQNIPGLSNNSQAVSALSYNEFGEQTGKVVTVSGPGQPSQAIYSEQLVRDQLGRITSSTRTILGEVFTSVYTYDTAGRLSSVTVDGTIMTSYVYDENGNVILKHTPSGDLVGVVDDQDRLISFGVETYSYDAKGNVTQVLNTSTNQAYTLAYDSQNNLVQVQIPGGAVINYVLDGMGRRVGKKVNGVLEEGYLYDSANRLVAETSGIGTVVKTFVYTVNAHSFDEIEGIGNSSGPVRETIVTDIRGTPIAEIVQAAGPAEAPGGSLYTDALLIRDEWGNPAAPSPGSNLPPGTSLPSTPFGFAGCLTDDAVLGVAIPGTPFCHFGAREYNPYSGRWLQRDPVGFAAGVPAQVAPGIFQPSVGNTIDTNKYGYALQDPVNHIDPSGNDWVTTTIIIGGIIYIITTDVGPPTPPITAPDPVLNAPPYPNPPGVPPANPPARPCQTFGSTSPCC